MFDYVVPIPLICCPDCGASYDLNEWRGLLLVGLTHDGRERRRCEGSRPFEPLCSRVLVLDVRNLRLRDTFMNAEQYAELYPDSARPRTHAIAVGSSWIDRLVLTARIWGLKW